MQMHWASRLWGPRAMVVGQVVHLCQVIPALKNYRNGILISMLENSYLSWKTKILLWGTFSNVLSSHARAFCLLSHMFQFLWMELGCYWCLLRLQWTFSYCQPGVQWFRSFCFGMRVICILTKVCSFASWKILT